MPVETRRRPPSQQPNPRNGLPRQRGGDGGPSANGKTKKRRKDPLWAQMLLVFGVILALTSGVGLVGSKVLLSTATSNIEQKNLIGNAGKDKTEAGKNLEGPIDMLLLGVDARAKSSADDVRSDTIIILHIPATHDRAYLISIPRDTEVRIPAWKKGNYSGGVDKINAAFQYGARNGGGWEGGAQLMALTIQKRTGISFDGAAIINFGGFKRIVDTLGTVRICVKQTVKSKHMSYVDGKPMWNADAKKTGKPMTPVVHKKGCQEMEGWEALDYSRQRYGLAHGDYDRQQNQQQLIKAMAKKATQGGILTNPMKLNRLLKAAGEALMMDTGNAKMEDYLFTLRNVTGDNLVTLRTNNGNFSGNSRERETLTPLSEEMFAAVKSDTLAQFVAANPEVLSDRKV